MMSALYTPDQLRHRAHVAAGGSPPSDPPPPAPLQPALGLRLRAARRARGLTLAGVAGPAGITLGHLSQVERGGCEPSLSVLVRVAGALGVAPAELLQG